MPFYPMKTALMDFAQLYQSRPEIFVQYRFFQPGFPTVSFPFLDPPLFESITHITRVRVNVHQTRLVQAFQSSNDRHQLHSIIRGTPVTLGNFFAVFFVKQNRGETARARVGRASAIGKDFYFFSGSLTVQGNQISPQRHRGHED